MHRWLCTTAPLLIGSIAVGTVDAAPTADACPRKHLARPPQAGQPDARVPVDESFADPLRTCTGCHDGTVARSEVDMRVEIFAGDSRAGPMPVRFDARQ